MAFLTTYFNHARAVQAAATRLGIHASVQLSDSALCLNDGQNKQTWRAKFMATLDGRLVYTDSMVKGTVGFAGWVPYALRQWPIAIDKSTFKRFAIAAGVPTPMACFDPALIGGPFIVKKANSSFGEGIRGPFLTYEANNPEHQLGESEYYENFILGHIAKAWCWGGECVALHLDAPSLVVGDGTSTLRELVLALPNARGGENDWAVIACLARYCGIGSVEEVVPPGKEVLVEFRYGSRYATEPGNNPNWLARLQGSHLMAQVVRATGAFSEATSSDPAQRDVLYTLDAIVDGQGLIWLLEMNCNPLVHPDAYRAMLGAGLSAAKTPERLEAVDHA